MKRKCEQRGWPKRELLLRPMKAPFYEPVDKRSVIRVERGIKPYPTKAAQSRKQRDDFIRLLPLKGII